MVDTLGVGVAPPEAMPAPEDHAEEHEVEDFPTSDTAAQAVAKAERPTYSAKPATLTLSQISDWSQVGCHRTEVILHLLVEAGLAKHGRDGYRLHMTAFPSDEELHTLLFAYEQRAVHDKDHLAEMMHYAETPTCRTQVLRAHFAEDAGEPCNRCDNCELVAAGVQNGVDNQAESTSAATTVTLETIHGVVQTTAPEVLPQPKLSPFAVGDAVLHQRFGPGKVRDLEGQNALVHFEKGGEKRVLTSFLGPAA